MIVIFIWIALLLPYVWGNTEKTIFLGPSPVDVQSTYSKLNHLRLAHLSPEDFTIRTHLEAEFPGIGSKHGRASWLVLNNLTEGQRYEVRVCWSATQPTAFRLEAYELDTVFGTPDLISDLSEYASTLQSNIENYVDTSSQALARKERDSVVLLRVFAAADFYTRNHTLMKDVPSVHVDIILDPFVSNLLPRSLLPTVMYIMVVAIVSWFAGKWISSRVSQIASGLAKQETKSQ
ncbi:hypothetical protein GGS21DRAFT_287944 [Xylaria nigripes]|nr:hypothetical protein GGS21DRAFT_287944 [Xylaria nigripes]